MKNLLFSLTMLCFAGNAFAQLYVAPNTTTSTDSYVYVDNQVVYVEQDVHLVKNPNNIATEASLYLRNGAQLLQGSTGDNTNKGNGRLSVYQESNADSYDYNMWSSPVSGMYGTGNVNFGLKRMSEVVSLTESTQAVESTTRFGTSSPLAISTRWMYYYNPITQRYVRSGAGQSIPSGYGFLMKGTDVTVHTDPFDEPQNQQYDFRGRPHNSDITIPVQTDVSILAADGLNYSLTLTGNPYPSALDLNLVFFDADNIEIDSFRFWDEDRSINSHLHTENKGGYSSWIPGPQPYLDGGAFTLPMFLNYDNSGTATTPTATIMQRYERLYSPIGQGFMVQAMPISGEDGFITIKNSHRAYYQEGSGFSIFRLTDQNNQGDTNGLVAANNSDSFASDPSTGAEPDPNVNVTPQIRIHTIFGDWSHFRDMLLMFHETSTDHYDRGLDAQHPMDGGNADTYFPLRYHGQNDAHRDRDLVIQTVPYTDVRKMIPIAFTLDQPNYFTLKVVEDINTPFENAYLYDNVTNHYHRINNNDDAYINLDAGVYEDRFFITFRAPLSGQVTGVVGDIDQEETENRKEVVANNIDFVQNNPIAQLEVNNPERHDIKQLNIFDMTGKLVYSQSNLGTQHRLNFPTGNLSDGVYVVKMTTVEEFEIDYKINVINK